MMQKSAHVKASDGTGAFKNKAVRITYRIEFILHCQIHSFLYLALPGMANISPMNGYTFSALNLDRS